MSSSRAGDPPGRVLRVPGADRAVLDIPTGRIILTRSHNDIIGSADELRALARALLAACDQAERGAEPGRWPAGFLDVLVAEGV